jgi:hypothetical protein
MAIDYIADFEIVVNRCACEKGPLVTCDRDSELVPEPAFPESADTLLAHTHSALLRSPCGNLHNLIRKIKACKLAKELRCRR